MKKILIWDYEIPLKDSGGPSGYLNNIYNYIQTYHPTDSIYFLSDLIESTKSEPDVNIIKEKGHKSMKKYLGRLIPQSLKKIVPFIKHISSWKPYDFLPRLKPTFDYRDFDIIHFHISYHLYVFNDVLRKENRNCLFLLTTHCPQPLAHELVEGMSPWKWLANYIRPKLEKKESLAWNHANYIIFPVPESIDVYKSNPYLKDYIEKKGSKFRFCATGISENYHKKHLDIRTMLNIPKDAFIVSYIGRHNEIKGFSELKKIGEKTLNTNDNIYFVIAGKEEPIRGLNHNRWIELGWIDYGNDLMEQSDLFILPNKDTYFDLIALEALRVGVPILMTQTGGNLYFQKNFHSSGLNFYPYGNNIGAAEEILKVYKQKLDGKLGISRKENKKLFSSRFTTKSFVTNYLKICGSLV